jgi:hypothetical protein
MKWNDYLAAFEAILDGTNRTAPYNDEAYLEYVKLNNSRQNRWIKKMELSEETMIALKNVKIQQKWTLITEPWCGDAAHISAFINAMAEASENIEIDIQLRDSEPYLIEDYLTNGGKAIPKLVVQDTHGNDLFTWGPRPKECQNLMLSLKETDLSAQEKKAELQKWYNKDKGVSIQQEITALLKELEKLVMA